MTLIFFPDKVSGSNKIIFKMTWIDFDSLTLIENDWLFLCIEVYMCIHYLRSFLDVLLK